MASYLFMAAPSRALLFWPERSLHKRFRSGEPPPGRVLSEARIGAPTGMQLAQEEEDSSDTGGCKSHGARIAYPEDGKLVDTALPEAALFRVEQRHVRQH